MEDLIAAQINVDEDATDDEVEDIVISNSDEEVEQDEVIFDSDEEVEQDEGIFDSDQDNDDSDSDNLDEDSNNSDEDNNDSDEDNDDSEDIESENSYEEVQEDSLIKSKDDKLKNKSKNKKPLTFKDKTSTRETIPVINKLRNNKNNKNFDKAQMHKDEAYNEQKTNISANDEDEYVYDSSDEEDIRNTIGNVPLKWYNEYDHVGYDWEGKKIPKPEKGDELDNFLKRMEDPNFWRTIKDPQTGQDVVLSEADIDLIVRIQKQKIPDVQFDEYAVS